MITKTQIVQDFTEAMGATGGTMEQLIEAVKAPDWWAIGITAVNALIMAWLAWRQVKLQRQQTKLQELQIRQQEYELYRRLFDLVDSIHRLARGFIFDIYWGLAFDRSVAYDNSYWKEQQQKISKIEESLRGHSADIELKFPEEVLTREKYFVLLSSISTVIRSISILVKDGQINGSINEELSTILSTQERGSDYMIERIGDYLLDNDSKQEMTKTLTTLFSFGEKLCDNDFLDKIKSKI